MDLLLDLLLELLLELLLPYVIIGWALRASLSKRRLTLAVWGSTWILKGLPGGSSKVFPRPSKKIFQGVPKASQGVPKASPDVHPRRAQDLPRHPPGLPKRVHGETCNFVNFVLPLRRNTNFSGLARYMLIPSWPRATTLARVGPKLIPSCCILAPVGLKLAHVGPKLTRSWPQVGPCWLTLAQSRTQVGQCWPMLAPSGLQVGPWWTILTQIGFKLAHPS